MKILPTPTQFHRDTQRFLRMRFPVGNSQGFTLIEMLVTVFVFSVIVIGVGGIFTDILALQRRGSGAQKVQENTQFVLELMAREIRVSKVDNQDAPLCDRTTLTIVHPVNGPVSYSTANGRIQRLAGGILTTLTSNDVNITRLNFCVAGTTVTSGVGDHLQARVGIILQASSQDSNPEDTVTFDLQTMVVSRDNDIEFFSY